jgi:3-deoxy-D-manno-octulosonic acid kinase
MSNAGRRIATKTGVMLADPELVGNEPSESTGRIFAPDYWQGQQQLTAVQGGRGAAWFVGPSGHWVLRHYRRGGLMARISRDLYGWSGEESVRSFAEWRLLQILFAKGLPVPRPVAAHYGRFGFAYRCDLITQRLPNTRSLSQSLETAALNEEIWRKIARVVAQLHRNGADHADLNAHNVLLDDKGEVSVIDFDRGRLRTAGSWQQGNLQRLQRSLLKVSANLPPERFSPLQWSWFLAAYRSSF